jgi:hypothetical protein
MPVKVDPHSVDHLANEISCKQCGRSGTIHWDDVSRLNSAMRELALIDGPFFERLGDKPPYPIELICRECGGIALTAYPSTALHDRWHYH